MITEAEVPGIKKDQFQELAKKSKENCSVLQALYSLEIKLEVNFKN